MDRAHQIEIVKLRLDAVRDASKRCRWLLAAITFAAMIQIAAIWNMYFSWTRNFALEPKLIAKSGTIERVLQERLLQSWVESTYLSVPILGIRISVSDASVVGSTAMIILAVWFYYAIRRENHVIGDILADSGPLDNDMFELAFSGVWATQVFATVTKRDEKIRTMEQARGALSPTDATPTWFVRLFRAAMKSIFFLPVFAVASVLVADVASIFLIRAPFRVGHTPIGWENIGITGWSMLGLCFVLGLVILLVLKEAWGFQQATIELLRDAERSIREQRTPQQQLHHPASPAARPSPN